MRKQFRQNYIEGNKKEEKRFFEYKEHPKISQYYSSKVSPSQKHISTEIYKESYQLPKNIQRSKEFYNYAEFTPYNQHNHNSSEKNIYTKNETYYTSSKNNMNNNFNLNEDRGGLYTNFKKRMIFGNTDLRNEYSPLADARVNIRKKLVEERDVNYQTDAQGNLLENFKYYEINNSRNNSAQKYDSITRIVGYSNLIPLHTRKMMKNYSNVNINKNGNYNKKIEHNYIIKKDVNIVQQNQKKEFKKPAQLNTIKKTEIVKKYEVKKPEIKKVEENKYKKYERKKEETVKKEVKQEIKKETKKTEIKKEVKKDYKEPIIIKRKENIKATFSTHSGRYNCGGDIANDIINSRKNYNANSTEKNVKKVEIVQKSSKSEKKVENKNKVNTQTKIQTTIKKKEEPKPVIKRSEIVKKEVKKITTNVKPIEKKEISSTVKKVNITENNYRKKEEIKKIDNTPPKKINYSKNINIKTESYGKIDENKYRRQNIDISNMINIKEINRIYEIKRNRNTTPKLKTKKINLGDNYKFYERKYMQSPDDNYFTIHQRRNQRVIYGEQIIESNGVRKMKMYKSKPYIMEERYNSQIINNSPNPCFKGENENYIISRKYYENNYTNGNRSRMNDDEDGMYYTEQGGSYYY